MKTTPYYCPHCMTPGACGYHGQLVFGDSAPPMCNHNEKPGKPCHDTPIKMVPVHTRGKQN